MGGFGQGWRPQVNMNLTNPASLGDLRLTDFEVGVSAGGLRAEQATGARYEKALGSVNYIAIGVPLKLRKVGAAITLQPTTSIYYTLTQQQAQGPFPTALTQAGRGGLNKIALSLGWNINSRISVGGTLGRAFGKINYQQYIEFNDTLGAYNLLNDGQNRFTALLPTLGVQYALPMKKDRKIIFGLSADLPTNLHNTQTLVATRYYINASTGGANIRDTVYKTAGTKVNYSTPLGFSGGIGYEIPYKLVAGVDFGVQDWSGKKFLNSSDSLGNTYHLNIGVGYTPKYDAIGSYLKRITYRAGYRMGRLPQRVQGIAIDERALTAGVSLPFNRTFSLLTFGMELGERGTLNHNLVRDRYALITFGATLNDRWFAKRRYE